MDQHTEGAVRYDSEGDDAVGLADETAEAEVGALLDAWHSAAGRLEEAHRAKCVEARLLREELDAKNADLAQRHRLADFGATVARIAQEMQHRIRSTQRPLELLASRLVNDFNGRDLLDQVVADLTVLESALADLLGFAGARRPEADVLSVRDLVDGARMALSHQLAHQAVHVVVDVPEDARATGDEELLQRAIVNVVLQALDQVPPGGEVVVAAAERREATELEIACGHCGESRHEGQPANTDPAAAVLRWAVVHHILQQHGGEAVALGDNHGGTSYVLRIPHHPPDTTSF